MDFFLSLALVLCCCVEMWVSDVRLDCRKRGRARPVNPLKLGHRLSTLNFRTCENSFFDDYKFYNIQFSGFSRRSTKGKEVSD
jgi:hypothetical protein